MPTLSLPFKGSFPHTQGIGARPSVYAKYGLEGHDGDDWVMPFGTPLYSPVNGKVQATGNDPNSWGIFIQVWDSNQRILVNLAHCSTLKVSQGQTVSKGQHIADSGNTGFSEAPHLHVAVAFTDGSGNRENTGNGFKGWYSILDGSRFSLDSLGTSSNTQSTSTNTGAQSGQSTAAGVSFDTAYPLIYPGWDRAGAQADFALYGARKWAEYQARQSSPTSSGKPDFNTAYPLIYPGWDRTAAEADYRLHGENKWNQYQEQTGQKKNIQGNSGNSQYIQSSPQQMSPVFYFQVTEKQEGSYINTETEQRGLGTLDLGSGTLNVGPQQILKKGQIIEYQSKNPNGGADLGKLEAVFGKSLTTKPSQGTPEINIVPQPAPEPTMQQTPIQQPIAPQAPQSDQLGQIISKLDQILSYITSIPNTPPDNGGVITPTQSGEGFIYITSEPVKASVYINEVFIKDYTPFNTPIDIPAGSYKLSIRKRDYIAHEEMIQVQPGQQFTKHIILDPKP